MSRSGNGAATRDRIKSFLTFWSVVVGAAWVGWHMGEPYGRAVLLMVLIAVAIRIAGRR